MEAIVYCLLVETDDGLVLVDTGFGIADCTRPSGLMRAFASVIGAPLEIDETAIRQIAQLGYQTSDVKHIVITHLHLDHTGGLPDFPSAKVHVSRTESETARRPRGLMERAHVHAHWAHGPDWVLHEQAGTKWFDLDAMPIVDGLSPAVLLIPLPGHTRGHCGVAIATANGWLFHCGDAASPFHPDTDLHPGASSEYPLRRLPAAFVRRVIGPQVPRLRKFRRERAAEVDLISSHDIDSYREHQ
jgi:glyoxylase-like metal-dependent hydrolase (beta-lactamase superfamily II)